MSTDSRHPITVIFDDISVEFCKHERFFKIMDMAGYQSPESSVEDFAAIFEVLNSSFKDWLWKRYDQAMQELPAIAAQLFEASQDASS